MLTNFCFRYLMVAIGLMAFVGQLMLTVSLQVHNYPETSA